MQKPEFTLKRSISHVWFDHIMGFKFAHEIWQTLDRLFNKKDEARWHILENELANTTQGNLLISEYILKIKHLCSEISLLNSDEVVPEARIIKKNDNSRFEARIYSIFDVNSRMGSTTVS